MTRSSPASAPLPLSSVTILTPAKINLVLRILDRRADGYHNLWSLIQTVGLEDDIAIRINSTPGRITLQCDVPSLKVDHTNLVFRAAAEVLRCSGRPVGLDIVLTKRIPMGAGLGGGSSDAAATIIALDRLLNLGWSPTEMAQVGQTLGSDVSFFFFAPSAAVTGRGEVVTPVHITGSRWVVIVNPGFSVDTRWAYQELSSTRTAVQPLSDPHLQLGREPRLSWERVLAVAENDFETPVFRTHPRLQTIKRALLDQGAEAALLSGSGATVFGVFLGEAEAQRVLAYFQTQPDLIVFAVPAGSLPRVSQL
ncbi:MAG TPA: 4-(cytidine 5'-diphospho)-2-C-methyl-D-erythritol kinase [Nitrospira sp.]|nr:4-(cytidine 5'-diphospho)-2-C-methyl-D-erythritol kinase [Nitrospira sp.]